jgi:cell division protein ZapA
MGLVNIKVGNRTYQLACEDGQEANILSVSEEVDKRVDILSRQLRTGNDTLLLVMTAIMIQEEFNEYRKKFELSKDSTKEKRDEEIAEILYSISGYLETLIDKIEK